MPAPTVAVTVKLFAQDGTPYADTEVRAKLDQNDVYEGFIVSDEVTGTTDATGTVVLNLFPNNPTTGLGTTGSSYIFKAQPVGGKSWRATAQIPNEACNLEDVVDTDVVLGRGAAEIAQDNAQASALAADASEAAALASQVAAAASAAAALASETAADASEAMALRTMVAGGVDPPDDPLPNAQWRNPANGKLYEYVADSDGSQWVEAGSHLYNDDPISVAAAEAARDASAASAAAALVSQGAAGVSAANAAASAVAAEVSRDAIDNRLYPGSYAEDPTLRPDGSACQAGDEYFSSSANLKKRYNGATWVASDINTANLAASGGSALMGFIQAGTGAVARTMQDKGRESVSIKDFGALGDGIADDGLAIRAALAAHDAVYCPPGNYRYAGAAAVPKSANQRLLGAGPDLTTITLDAGVQFQSATAADRLHVEGITFSGGLGAFQYTDTGVNVSGIKLFSNCVFEGYTRCAVEQNHVDSPYWQFYNCVFDAANSTSTIGVALGGDPSGSAFNGCAFLRNRIHIKGRQGLIGASIINCDFIQFDAGNGTPRAFIWAVPWASNSTFGLKVSDSKFGPENQQSTDYRILYADEGAGALNGDKFPSLSADSTGYVYGHTFDNIVVSGAAFSPLIYSTADHVSDITLDNIVIAGTQPTYLVEYRTPTTTMDRDDYRLSIGRITGEFSINTVPIPVSNNTLQKLVQDSEGVFENDATNHAAYPVTGANRVGYTELWTTRIGAFGAAGGATKTGDIADATGGAEAAEFNFAAGAGLVLGYTAVAPTPGEPSWLQLDLKRAASSPVTVVKVRLRLDGNGAILWTRFINVPTEWRAFKFPVFFRSSAANQIIEFTSGSGENIQIGRVRCYHSREPIITSYATFDQLNLSALPTSSAGLPAGAIWVDAAAANVLKRA
jgi:hypothetical protein